MDISNLNIIPKTDPLSLPQRVQDPMTYRQSEEPSHQSLAVAGRIENEEKPKHQPKMCQNCGKLYTTRYCNLRCLYYKGPLFHSVPYKVGDVKEPESRGETRPEINPKPESGTDFSSEWYTRKNLDRLEELIRKYPNARA